jgi:hypothetical protein
MSKFLSQSDVFQKNMNNANIGDKAAYSHNRIALTANASSNANKRIASATNIIRLNVVPNSIEKPDVIHSEISNLEILSKSFTLNIV